MNRENELWSVAMKYMHGEISLEEKKAIEKPYYDAEKRAMLTISAREVRPQWRCPITRVLRWRKRNAI